MCVAHWYITSGCSCSNSGSNPGILPRQIVYIYKVKTLDGEWTLLDPGNKNSSKKMSCTVQNFAL